MASKKLRKSKTHPRVAIGDSWEGLEVEVEKAETEKEIHRTQEWVSKYALLPAFLILAALMLYAMKTEDIVHINKAWELTTLVICTLLFGRSQSIPSKN